MRLSSLAARFRRPAVVTASVAVMATGFLPAQGAAPVAAPIVHRVIATPKPIPVFTPRTIAIPKLGLEAPVVPVGTMQSGAMGSPTTARDIGWWAGRKAGNGNLLLDAHHDWNGAEGSFYNLYKLVAGDTVVVKGDTPDKQLVYRVIWLKDYDRLIDATDLLGNENGQVATLITCGGSFDTRAGTHTKRVVVRAALVTT